MKDDCVCCESDAVYDVVLEKEGGGRETEQFCDACVDYYWRIKIPSNISQIKRLT